MSLFDEVSLYFKPLLEGFLLKKGQGINLGLKRRWFVLSEGRMYYYKTSDAVRGTELGFIDLTKEYNLIYDPSDPCKFRISTQPRIWYLTAEAEEECRFWVEGIKSYQKRRKHRDSIRSIRLENITHDDEREDLKLRLSEAEMELEANRIHVDELYQDLQNSIQIIKHKNEQIDHLSTQISLIEEEEKIEEQQIQIDDEESNPLDEIHDELNIDELNNNENNNNFYAVSYDEKWLSSSKKCPTRNSRGIFAEYRSAHNLPKKEEKEEISEPNRRQTLSQTKVDELEEENNEGDLLHHLNSSMQNFLEYLEGDDNSKSSIIAVSVWIKTISKFQKDQQIKKSALNKTDINSDNVNETE